MRPVAIVLAAVLLLNVSLFAEKKEKDKEPALPSQTQVAVMKYVGSRQGNLQGKNVLFLIASPAGTTGGGNVQLPIPNQDPDSKKLDPPAEIQEFIKQCTPGAMMEVTIKVTGSQMLVDRLANYQGKLGEEDPNVFRLIESSQEKVNAKDVTVVKVSRFMREHVFQVPPARNAEGKLEPKPEMVEALSALKEGDLVEVVTVSGGKVPMIKTIKAYDAPKYAEMVKLDKETVDDQELNVLEITVHGKVSRLLISRKDAPVMMPKLRLLKEGAVILYRSSTQEKGTFLTDLRVQPKGTTMPEEAKPEAENADGEKKKDGDKNVDKKEPQEKSSKEKDVTENKDREEKGDNQKGGKEKSAIQKEAVKKGDGAKEEGKAAEEKL